MKLDNWIKIIIVFGGILLFLPIILYLLKFGSGILSKEFSVWNQFSSYLNGTLGVYISLLTLIITALIAIEFNNFQKRQTTIQLFKEFRTKEILTHRSKAWEVKKQWKKNKNNYRDEFILSMINENKIITASVKITNKQIKGVYELFAFYSMLSTYKKQKLIIGRLNYFYYAWWREFLYEVAEKYDRERMNDINEIIRKQKSKDSEVFLENIKFTPKLIELDKICGLQNFSKKNKTMNIYIRNS